MFLAVSGRDNKRNNTDGQENDTYQHNNILQCIGWPDQKSQTEQNR
jgi:hypothetical protein